MSEMTTPINWPGAALHIMGYGISATGIVRFVEAPSGMTAIVGLVAVFVGLALIDMGRA